MKAKRNILLMFIASMTIVSFAAAPIVHADAWDDFLQKNCPVTNPGEAANCKNDYTNQLKESCGKPVDIKKYRDCRQKFIADVEQKRKDESGVVETPEPRQFDEEATTGGCKWLEDHGGTSIIPCEGDGVISLVLYFVNFLAVGVGIAVVGGIAWGGFTYTQANGNSSKAQEGITAITNSVIGLVLFIVMYALLNFFIPGGIFN